MDDAVIFFLAVCEGRQQPTRIRNMARATYVVAVRQVAAIRETKTHEAVLGLDERGESGEAAYRMSKAATSTTRASTYLAV